MHRCELLIGKGFSISKSFFILPHTVNKTKTGPSPCGCCGAEYNSPFNLQLLLGYPWHFAVKRNCIYDLLEGVSATKTLKCQVQLSCYPKISTWSSLVTETYYIQWIRGKESTWWKFLGKLISTVYMWQSRRPSAFLSKEIYSSGLK